MDLLGGVLLYLGLTSSVFGVASLVWPLRFVGIRTRKAALIVLLLGFFVFTAAVFLPSGETRVATVRSHLDEFAPVFQFNEVHSILIDAPKNRIYTAIRRVKPDEIRFFKPLMRIRFLKSPPDDGRPVLDSFVSGGFVLLADDPDREVVFGRALHAGTPLPPGQFAAFRQAPFLRIVMNFRIAEVDPSHCLVTTETRVYAVGGDMLRGFRAYWRMILPGSALIRRSWLRAIKLRAETASAIYTSGWISKRYAVIGSYIGPWTPSSVEGIGASVAPVFLAAESPRSSGDTLGGVGSSAGAPSTNRTTLYKMIAGVWLCGVVCVVLIRFRGWRRIHILIRGSVFTDIAAPVETRASPGLMEPGVVGWRRPLLLLPQGITERVAPSEMNAILAHELCHVRRRDNLLALIHMIVEAIFWFHPLVWWIGARLIEERECACDEDVVSRGNPPDLYAEAIVKVCKWSTESPLTCVAGVTGGDLKRRIEQIMNARDLPGLSFAKKAALTIAGAAVLMAPVLVGIANAPAILAQSPSGPPQWQTAAGSHMAFEIASVKPVKLGSHWRPPNFALDDGDGFRTISGENPHGRLSVAWSVPVFISFAYKLRLAEDQRHAMLARLPKWVDTDFFEIEAKAAGAPTKDQMRLMMQSLLAERFHLAVHYEAQEMLVYDLTLIKPGTWGPKLIRHADGPPCDVSGRQDPVTGYPNSGAYVFPPRCEAQTSVPGKYGRILQGTRNTTMDILAGFLARTAGRPVVDRTGITDRIDYRLEWTPEIGPATPGVEVEPDPYPLTFVDAVREQLGLKLQPTKGSVRTLVIDRIERPSEN